MEENNIEKEVKETTEEAAEVTEENGEEVKEAIEIEEAPKVKKERNLGFLEFLFANLIDLIAILFLSMIGLLLTGLVLKLLGYYVKENLTLYLLIVPIISVLYNTISENALKATFGKKILGIKLIK